MLDRWTDTQTDRQLWEKQDGGRHNFMKLIINMFHYNVGLDVKLCQIGFGSN